MRGINLAIVGASGLVGLQFLRVLKERNLKIDQLYLLASGASAGKKLKFNGKEYTIEELNEESFEREIDYAFFCASNEVSEKYAPIAVKNGIIVIDNSSHFRMDEDVPLVVPEVNPHDLKNHKNIIANPNCTTIQAVVVLNPIHQAYKLKRVIISSYQAVSGAGKEGIIDLVNGISKLTWQTQRLHDTLTYSNNELNPINLLSPYHHYELKAMPTYIAGNVIPFIGSIDSDGYSTEELKIINETKKIMKLPNLAITATAIRVPVINGHSESINIEFENTYDLDDLINILENAPSVKVSENPTPMKVSGNDEVFVGRIRRDNSSNGLNLFLVADNVRKGAATNGVQIMELLMKG